VDPYRMKLTLIYPEGRVMESERALVKKGYDYKWRELETLLPEMAWEMADEIVDQINEARDAQIKELD
jgi:hypothetical protein